MVSWRVPVLPEGIHASDAATPVGANSLRSPSEHSPFACRYVFMTLPTASNEEVHMKIDSTIDQKSTLCAPAAADHRALLG